MTQTHDQSKPAISVVLTCFNEQHNIGPCIASLLAQDYAGPFEIVVADGGSSDGTADIIRDYVTQDSRVRLIIEPKKGTAAGRNAALVNCSYNLAALIDADCEAPEDWLSILVEAFLKLRIQDPAICAVGGNNRSPQDSSRFVRAIELSLDSYPGSFDSVQGRVYNDVRPVSSVANLNALYDLEAMREMDFYDETLESDAEDADLNYRLHQAERTFYFLPRSFVWHKMRPTPNGWLKNMFRYGRGRARLLKRHSAMWRVAYVLPLLFALGMTLPLFSFKFPVLALPLLYFPAIACYAFFLSKKKQQPHLWPHVTLVFIIQHFGYAAGETYGLMNPDIR